MAKLLLRIRLGLKTISSVSWCKPMVGRAIWLYQIPTNWKCGARWPKAPPMPPGFFCPGKGLKPSTKPMLLSNAFRLSDYHIPYGYSPLLITYEELIEQEPELLRAFVQAVEKGWRFVNDHPGRAAEILCDHIRHPDFRNRDMIRESLSLLQPAILGDDDVGVLWTEHAGFLG